MRLLTLNFPTQKDFLFAYANGNGNASLFYSTRRSDLSPGDSVLVEVTYPTLPNKALLRATVGEVALGDGITLWLSPEDASTYEFMASLALGDVEVKATAPRSHYRFPTQLPVQCRVEGKKPMWLRSKTIDLSSGGTFLESKKIPEIGAPVRLNIGPSGESTESYLVYGVVAWTNDKGFGVRFKSRGREDALRLRKALRRARETGEFALAA